MDKIVRAVCDEMFAQRNYVFVEPEELLPDVEAVAQKPSGDFVLLCSNPAGKINTAKIQHFINIIQRYNVNHCVIVYRQKMTAIGRKMVDELNAIYKVELFSEDELKYNITKHYLVPKHELHLAAAASKDFKKKYGNLPVLLRTDPVVRFLGFEVGDVVKVQRQNGIVVFRYVK